MQFKSVPWIGIAMVVIALFTLLEFSAHPREPLGVIADDVVSIGLFIAGIIAIYARLVLNRLDVLTNGAREHDTEVPAAE